MEVWQIAIIGSPTGGWFSLGGIPIPHNATSDDVAEKLSAQLGCPVNASGGPFPEFSILVEIPGEVNVPSLDYSPLVGSGVGALVTRIQPYGVA